jgi:hypothetical protein
MEKEVVSEGQFRNQVVKFDADTLLQMCNRYSVMIANREEGTLSIPWPNNARPFSKPQTVIVALHKLALLAMIIVQNHPWAMCTIPSEKNFLLLANNVGAVESPIEKDLQMTSKDLISVLVRLTCQQFPFLEDLRPAIPRHLLLYLKTSVSNPSINPNDTLNRSKGLSILDFITLGLCFYAMSQDKRTFSIRDIQDAADQHMKLYITDEKIKAFISIIGADLVTLRQFCLKEVRQSPSAGLYRFNPMFDRPVIIRKDSTFCVPVPFLIINAVTKGLYYDLLDEFYTGNGNPFSDWFGYAFEQYGGLLLNDAFDNKRVFSEPVYGKEEKRGPDWIVLCGETAILFEFRSGRLHKRAKTHGDYEEVVLLLRRNIVETVKKLPNKIDDLKSGKTAIDLTGVKEYIPCIVTYESLYPTEFYREIITKELQKDNIPEFDFELMSISDLELVLAWSSYEDIVNFLKKKWSDPQIKLINASKVVFSRATEQGINRLENRLLSDTMDKFWKEIAAEKSSNSS